MRKTDFFADRTKQRKTLCQTLILIRLSRFGFSQFAFKEDFYKIKLVWNLNLVKFAFGLTAIPLLYQKRQAEK